MILIVGAGPTGLVLGCELARRRVPFRLIDQAAEPFPGSRGKGLSPRTLEVFDALGIVDAVMTAGGPFPVFRAYQGEKTLWDRSLYELGGFARLEPSPDRPYTEYWMLAQSITDRLLRERLAALGGQVERGVALVGLDADDDGVTATLQGPSGEETFRASYLVGADGGRSATRKLAGIGFLGETKESDRSVVADVYATGVDRERWHMWVTPGQPERRIALCPLPGTDYFQLAAPLGDGPFEPTLENLQALFDDRAGVPVTLHDLRWASVHTVNVRLAERFQQGRVLLAGDAAHVHSPAGGQGLNTSIQDAFNLGWKLASGDPALIATYEAERLPIAAAVLGLTSELSRRGFGGGEGALREDIYQLDLGYRGGPLSRGRTAVLEAGDRAPNARWPGGSVFDRLRHPRGTVIEYGVDVPLDADGEFARFYGVTPGQFVAIRPDGYVGLITGVRAEAFAYPKLAPIRA